MTDDAAPEDAPAADQPIAETAPPAEAAPVEGAPEAEAGAEAGPSAVGEMVEIVKTITYALLIALFLRVLFFQPFTIPSASMEPNLLKGDYIIVAKYAYGYSRHSIPLSPPLFKGRLFAHEPKRGDIIVFKLPRDGHMDYIKRLIGLPGDKIQVIGGVILINGKPVSHVPGKSFVAENGGWPVQATEYREEIRPGKFIMTQQISGYGSADNTGVYTVPKGCYFFMGDNRDNSADSRFDPGLEPGSFAANACPWDYSLDRQIGENLGVGFVPAENLVGKAQIILLSWNGKASLFKPWTWFLDARPSRFFHVLK
ncbi:signal peptidase I [Caulobacter ginsengisoli]|uniref:Signal peptidase I n=2 Tax=Caulobacter ginsengisoli TaxID=400775 RepID=A0ABU0IQ13_9CAUL|nr:signal peptidase I [Caulobacter ginsengisoli]MDQ0463258.1 signal peptidase I [Caulobacter ginsengisoli]